MNVSVGGRGRAGFGRGTRMKPRERKLRETRPREKGFVMVIVAASLVALLGFAALVTDVGLLYWVRASLQNAADAAVLAGIRYLPDQPTQAESVARDYAARNGVGPPDGAVTVEVLDQASRLRVTTSRTVNLLFGRVLGFTQSAVGARASARIGAVREVDGALPFGVERQNFEYGAVYTLKYSPGSEPAPGNFGLLALGGRGAGNYLQNVMYGFAGMLHVGDVVETEPGNKSGPTREGIEYRLRLSPEDRWYDPYPGDKRLLKVPIVDSFAGVHGRDTVTVVGFAVFYLEELGGPGNEAWITGRFLRWLDDEGKPGESVGGPDDFGYWNYELVE